MSLSGEPSTSVCICLVPTDHVWLFFVASDSFASITNYQYAACPPLSTLMSGVTTPSTLSLFSDLFKLFQCPFQRPSCCPRAQPTQHTATVTPHRALFRQEKFMNTMHDASHWNRLLLPQGMLYSQRKNTRRHYRHSLAAAEVYSAQPHNWNRLCFCWVYHIVTSLVHMTYMLQFEGECQIWFDMF